MDYFPQNTDITGFCWPPTLVKRNYHKELQFSNIKLKTKNGYFTRGRAKGIVTIVDSNSREHHNV